MGTEFTWTEIKVERYAQYYCNNEKWFSYNGTEKSQKRLYDFKQAYTEEVANTRAENVTKALDILKREGYQVSKLIEIVPEKLLNK
tara:strand:- start:1090 stop:1347 length:258 start_codon:yes stop_codon:yes gene_type:complete